MAGVSALHEYIAYAQVAYADWLYFFCHGTSACIAVDNAQVLVKDFPCCTLGIASLPSAACEPVAVHVLAEGHVDSAFAVKTNLGVFTAGVIVFGTHFHAGIGTLEQVFAKLGKVVDCNVEALAF